MKISIICSCLTHGGAEHCAVMWANGLTKQGHKVMVVTNLFEPITFQLNNEIELFDLVKYNKNKWQKWASSIQCVRHAIKQFCPDVVIGVMPTCSFIAKAAVIGLHVPVVATEHNSFERPQSAPFPFIEKFAKYILNYLYDGVTVLTEADNKIIYGRFKNSKVMPNPLSLIPVRDTFNKTNVVIAAGRLDAWHYKGFDVLIRAWGQIIRKKTIDNGRLIMDNEQFDVQSLKLTEWKLQIAGTGSEASLQYLKQLCKENGVENSVDFLGFVSDMESLYKRASVFALSSRYEGFGLVLIEAMSQGCACVACDYKGRQREIICPGGVNDSFKFQDSSSNTSSFKNQKSKVLECGAIDTCNLKPETHLQPEANLQPETTPLRGVEVCENGILCEPDNVEALASALEKMIDDDAYRESVRTHAIERSKYYDMEHTMKRWEEYLNTIVNIK